MTGYKYEYTITSIRMHSDEIDNRFWSNNSYEVGELIELDGIKWEIITRKEVN